MADKPDKPSVPTYKPLTLPAYQAVNVAGTAKKLLPILSQYADVNIGKQAQAQGTLTRGAADLTSELAPQLAQARVDTDAAYSPKITQQYLDLINQADPTFQAVRNKLGANTLNDLNAGYDLGDDLSREVEQDVRKGQTSRGNWLGPAPTADEAFAKASARIGLYQQRQNAATNFLSSRAPADMFAEYGGVSGYQPVNAITPTGTYVDPSIPVSAATAEAQNRANYNNATVGAYGANTAAQNAIYDRSWNQYLFGSASGSGGGGGSMTAAGGNPWGGALGGAASGAVSGAVVGSSFGPYGTVIGAGVGAIAGGVGGYASSS